MVGTGRRVMVTWSDVEGHVPFEIVHCKTFVPTDKLVTADVADNGAEIIPVPEITVQNPLPVAGTFPANVEDEEQIV